MRTSPFRSVLAPILALCTVMTLLATPATSGDQAFLGGRVFDSDGVTPREGVTVALVDPDTREVYRSKPSGKEGAFRIEEAPAGSYRMLAETSEGAFLASDAVALTAGQNRPLSLALNASAAEAPDTTAGAAGSEGMPLWAEIVIAGSIAVGALLVIDELSTEVEPQASTF